ncbi:MAG: hypothetical protein ABID40_04130 [Candidatus Bipolaricaulota bacterium]
MMDKSQLLQAYRAAGKEAHTRPFTVAGIEIRVPRLNLWNQAQFEAVVRKDDPKFSLASTRNRSAMAMARCSETAMRDLRERGVPDEFKSEQDARMWKQEFLAHLLSGWEPYAEALFGMFTRRHMSEALVMAIRQGYGETIEEGGEKFTVDRAFVDVLFGGAAGQVLETAFLWSTGLQDVPEEAAGGDAAKTLDQMVDQLVGNPKGSGSVEAESGTTPSSSPSSAPPTD